MELTHVKQAEHTWRDMSWNHLIYDAWNRTSGIRHGMWHCIWHMIYDILTMAHDIWYTTYDLWNTTCFQTLGLWILACIDLLRTNYGFSMVWRITPMYLDMGFETLTLKICELTSWELTVEQNMSRRVNIWGAAGRQTDGAGGRPAGRRCAWACLRGSAGRQGSGAGGRQEERQVPVGTPKGGTGLGGDQGDPQKH